MIESHPQALANIRAAAQRIKTKQGGEAIRPFLFSGATGCGKKTHTSELVKLLTQNTPTDTKRADTLTAPDILHIPGHDAQADTFKNQTQDFADTPTNEWQYKFLILSDLHLVRRDLQDSLLKILEEPQPHTITILTTSNSDGVAPAIRSRSFAIHFSYPTQDTLYQILQNNPAKHQPYTSLIKEHNLPTPIHGLLYSKLRIPQKIQNLTEPDSPKSIEDETKKLVNDLKDQTIMDQIEATRFILTQVTQAVLKQTKFGAAANEQGLLYHDLITRIVDSYNQSLIQKLNNASWTISTTNQIRALFTDLYMAKRIAFP